MNLLSLSATLRAAVLAALVAGIVVAGFHRFATEPVIDQAITLEEQASHDHEAPAGEPIVSRDAQRIGLFVGMVLYGLTWSLFFAAAYQRCQTWLPASTPATRAALLVLGAYFAVVLFPFLKYPANPPGVGEADSIVLRQQLYLLAIAVGCAGVALALALARSLRGRGETVKWLAPLGFLIVFGLVAYVAMPSNPDTVRLPGELVGSFRALSLLGLTLFWFLFGTAFVLLVRSVDREPRAASA